MTSPHRSEPTPSLARTRGRSTLIELRADREPADDLLAARSRGDQTQDLPLSIAEFSPLLDHRSRPEPSLHRFGASAAGRRSIIIRARNGQRAELQLCQDRGQNKALSDEAALEMLLEALKAQAS